MCSGRVSRADEGADIDNDGSDASPAGISKCRDLPLKNFGEEVFEATGPTLAGVGNRVEIATAEGIGFRQRGNLGQKFIQMFPAEDNMAD